MNNAYIVGFRIGSGKSSGRLSKSDQAIIDADPDSYERGLLDGEVSLEQETADNTYNVITKKSPTSFWRR